MSYIQEYDINGRFKGVIKDNLLHIPNDNANTNWQDFLVWNAQQITPLSLTDIASNLKTKRSLYSIRTDVVNLTGSQKTNLWNALITGSPPLWATDVGLNSAAIAVLQMLGASGTLNAADMLEAKIRAASMYIQDNPNWAINPSFDNSINIPGEE